MLQAKGWNIQRFEKLICWIVLWQQLYERVKIDKADVAVYCEIEQSKGGIAMRKPRYQNEDIMKALGIKTKEERYAYNIALID